MLDAPNGHGSRHGQEALAGLQMMKSKSKRKSKQTNKQMKKINNKAKEKNNHTAIACWREKT